MERNQKSIVFLDTHIVLWLFEAKIEKLSQRAQLLIETNQLLISPMVELELKFLKEIKKIHHTPDTILRNLSSTIGLEIAYTNFHQVIQHSINMNWTRDPFDRIITAETSVYETHLITHEKTILAHYPKAVS